MENIDFSRRFLMSGKILKFRIIFLSISFIFLLISHASAAITVDNTSSAASSDTILGVGSLTFPHTVSTCSNCVLYVTVTTFTQANFNSPRVNSSNITYAGQSLASVGTQVSPFPAFPASGNSSVEIFRLVNPPVGTGNVVVNFVIPVNYTLGAAISLNGVSQTIPNGAITAQSGNANSFTANVAGTVATDLVIDTVGATPNSGFLVEDISQTVCTDEFNETTCLRGRRFFGNAFDVGSTSRKTGLTGVTPMSWTLTTAQSYAYIGFPVRQFVVTAASVSISGRITDATGRPVGKANVSLTTADGQTFSALTNPFGYYRFLNISVGQTVTVNVSSKRHSFSPQVINVTENVDNFDFTAQNK
jgi:hypothetical protein